MRIGILLDQIVPGASESYPHEVDSLNRLGYPADLLLLRTEGPLPPRFGSLPTVDLSASLPKTLRSSGRFPGFNFFSPFHLLAALYAPLVLPDKYRLLVAHGTYTCFSGFTLGAARRIPVYAFIWDPAAYIVGKAYSHQKLAMAIKVLLPLSREVDRVVFRFSRRVLLPSHYHLRYVDGFRHNGTSVVYPGTEYAGTQYADANKKGFISVARWEPGKDPWFLVEVLSLVCKKVNSIRLTLVGPWRSDSLRTEVLKLARSLDVRDNLVLSGRADKTRLRSLYRMSLALVHPIVESFGFTGLEAAANGTALVFPRPSGITELFVDEDAGRFPEEGDAQAFADALLEYHTDPRLATTHGKKAWRVAQAYTWENHARRLIEVLE